MSVLVSLRVMKQRVVVEIAPFGTTLQDNPSRPSCVSSNPQSSVFRCGDFATYDNPGIITMPFAMAWMLLMKTLNKRALHNYPALALCAPTLPICTDVSGADILTCQSRKHVESLMIAAFHSGELIKTGL